jgi:hypothetical protein
MIRSFITIIKSNQVLHIATESNNRSSVVLAIALKLAYSTHQKVKHGRNVVLTAAKLSLLLLVLLKEARRTAES